MFGMNSNYYDKTCIKDFFLTQLIPSELSYTNPTTCNEKIMITINSCMSMYEFEYLNEEKTTLQFIGNSNVEKQHE